MAVAGQYVEKEFYTEEEYLRWEETAVERSEYLEGQIRAMSGGSEAHANIPMNLGAAFITVMRGRSCRVLSSDMKVRAAGAIYYPDLTIVCGPSKYHSKNKTVLTNPVTVVEVLSPGTADKDRGEKFLRYQQIESLRAYLLVSQDRPLLELFSRGENGDWDYTQASGLESSLAIPALSISLALADIYDQIDFSEAGDERFCYE